MRRKRHTALWILLTLVIVLGALVCWQRNNISAVMQGRKYSPEEIEQQLLDNEKKVQEAVENSSDITVRDLTADEKVALKDGLIEREEIIEKLTEKEKTEGDNKSTEEKDYQKELSALIAELYVLQAEYNTELENMIEQAKQEYSAMSEKGRSKVELVKWAGGFVSRATTLEKECDGKIDNLVAKISDLIKKNNGDDSIVDQVIYTYAQEKSLKKAWYLSEMQKRGLLG